MLCGSCRTAILSRSFLQSNQAITALPSFTLRGKGAEASSWQVPMTWSSACDCAGGMLSLCPQCCSSALAFGGWIHLLNPASLLTRESIGSERSCMRRKVRPLIKWHGQNLSPNAWGTAGAPVWPWMKTVPCSDQAACLDYFLLLSGSELSAFPLHSQDVTTSTLPWPGLGQLSLCLASNGLSVT